MCCLTNLIISGEQGWNGSQAFQYYSSLSLHIFSLASPGALGVLNLVQRGFYSIFLIKNYSPRPTNHSQNWQATSCVGETCTYFLNTMKNKIKEAYLLNFWVITGRGWFAKAKSHHLNLVFAFEFVLGTNSINVQASIQRQDGLPPKDCGIQPLQYKRFCNVITCSCTNNNPRGVRNVLGLNLFRVLWFGCETQLRLVTNRGVQGVER